MSTNENRFPKQIAFPDHCYLRDLEIDETGVNGDDVPVYIMVQDVTIGYNVLRIGAECDHLEWFQQREDAIEFAVDRYRFEICQNEIREARGDFDNL